MTPLSVHAEISYLARDEVYREEKPYAFTFAIPDIPHAKPSNHLSEPHPVLVNDVRGEGPISLEECGFTLLNHDSMLTPDDFESSDVIETSYYQELTTLIRGSFPQYTDLVFLDHEVRKRSPLFPSNRDPRKYTYSQPLTLAHVDFTDTCAAERINQVTDLRHPDLKGRRFEVLNFWRVLKGPNNDWPLALCDYKNVDPEHDVIANDIIFPTAVGENRLLMANKNHRWFYMSNQMPNEIMVFRNASSAGACSACAFHASFLHPSAAENVAPLRHSVEVRVAAFLPGYVD